MFNQLTERLTHSINKLRGLGRLTESNIQSTLQEVREALLDADVALPVVTDFMKALREKAIGQTVIANVRPGEALIKVVQDELTHLLGGAHADINLNAIPPVVILLAGLQGSGKTTTAAKLAKWLTDTHHKKVLLASTDVYRPAAIEQLHVLANQLNIACVKSDSASPEKIAAAAVAQAQTQLFDIVVLDTAGRLHIDDAMMREIKAIRDITKPTEILLVVDSMMGQDAANVAKTFHEALAISGIILTKTDGDARGGAALSMRMITAQPIKFIGTGEKMEAFAPFHPERMASRILGMGDIVSLVEEAQRKVDQQQAQKIAKKLKKGKPFDFSDFLGQLQQMKKMGGMQSLLGKLPNMGALPKGVAAFTDDKLLVSMEAMIQSMTPRERRFPALINGSRKRRIALGSGNPIQNVNKLLKQFVQMQKMMKRMRGEKMMQKLKQMQGKLPSDLLNPLPPDWPPK